MTLPEYLFRMKAHSLARVDKEYDFHLQAWLSRAINATETKGDKEVYVYKSFKDFYDYEKEITSISKPKDKSLNDQHKRMAQIAANLNNP